jgi:hypothetical protein
MRINSDGNLALVKNIGLGGATPTTSGTGITFPASASASTNANTLDDYEEGTFTATLTSAVAPTTPPTSIYAAYTKIGRIVTIQAYFADADTSGGSGEMRVTGLPFTSQNVANSSIFGIVYRSSIGVGDLACFLTTNSTTLTFNETDALTSGNFAIVAGTGKYLMLTITYLT